MVERRTRDRKAVGSIPGRSGEIISFSTVNLLCWLFILWLFYQRCRLQVPAKHAYTLEPTESDWADCAVRAQRGNPSSKQAPTQLVMESSFTVVSAR